MKRTVMVLTALLVLQNDTAAAERVEEQREWTERFAVSTSAPTLEIQNIWGDVRVMPGSEGEITLAIREHRSAPSQALFERSLDVYGLDIQAGDEAVDVRVGEHGQSWHGRDPCRRCRVDFEFEVRVPPAARVYASTVNDGVVEIAGIRGQISASNVNGPVTIHQASACDVVESVNGEVSLSFATTPASDCRLETINGDIRLQVPGGSGLDLAVDLGNGRMTSELPVDPLAIPARVEHHESGRGHQYRIEQAAGVRLAGGGAVFSVSSMNGDLRITESTNSKTQ
jgi:hypothetical protein